MEIDGLPRSESSSDRLSFSSDWPTPDEIDELSESINKSFQKNAVVVNNKPTSGRRDASSLTLSKIRASPPENSGLEKKAAAAKAKSVPSAPLKINVPPADSTKKGAIVNKPTTPLAPSEIRASPRGNSDSREKAKAESPKVGISRNTTTVLQKKAARNNESPEINVPSKEPTKVTKRAPAVKSNFSSVIAKPSAPTTATDLRGDSLANKRDVPARGTGYNGRSSARRTTVTVTASKPSYANLPKASSLPNDVPPTAGFDEPAYGQWSAPCGYADYNYGTPASFGSDTDVLQRAGSHHCVTQCDSISAGIGDDFDAVSSDVSQRSHRGDGDAANIMPSRKPLGRFRADRDAEKHAARKPAVNEPFVFLRSASEDGFEFALTKQSKIKKMNQIVNAYVSPVGGSSRTTVRKPCTPVGPLVSSSYINRQKKFKEIESTNMFIAKKILSAKPTISSCR